LPAKPALARRFEAVTDCARSGQRLSDAGLDGMAISTVNYVQEMPIIQTEVLPRLERLGLRKPLH